MADKNHTDMSEGKKKPSVIKIILFIVGGLFLLGILGSLFNKDNSDNTVLENGSDKATEEITYTEIDLKAFIDEYDENKVSADNKYEGKYVKSTGYIYDISEDFTGGTYLLINPTNEDLYLGASIQCNLKDKNDVSGLKKDSKVSFRGQVSGIEIFNIFINGCEVL